MCICMYSASGALSGLTYKICATIREPLRVKVIQVSFCFTSLECSVNVVYYFSYSITLSRSD